MNPPNLLGVLVTYRRPRDLASTLARLAGQDHVLDRLVVVDNDPGTETREIVESAGGASRAPAEYLAMTENVGFPGGLAAGIDGLLAEAADEDWIVVLDDDDPPESSAVFADLLGFAQRMVERDDRTAAVGIRGARFDARKGLLVRVPTHEIGDAVRVDYIAGNALPLYRVGALRDAGSFSPPLFFSHEELDIGLRLERKGYTLYADGVRWRERRSATGRPDELNEERWRILTPNWRSYYSLRNAIFIMRDNGRPGAALRITFSRGLLKPLVNLPRSPRLAGKALALNRRACVDAWRGRLGRRVEPNVEQPRPKKVAAPRH
ncbi:MAG: glycosyltransferase family 2 protein [Actinomycetota bacterium]